LRIDLNWKYIIFVITNSFYVYLGKQEFKKKQYTNSISDGNTNQKKNILMLKLKSIQEINDPDFDAIYKLYDSAFPPNERRTRTELELIFKATDNFFINSIHFNAEFAGLLNFWQFDDFIYVEHFAIIEKFRSQKMGSTLLENFIENTNVSIIIEVEQATNALAARRISFYEKLGFYLIHLPYAQPPYDGISEFTPMHIMCNNASFAITHFEQIKNKIYENVYSWRQG
jgi:ribosomal protein S18 acetylase RimI-like enzyme